MRLPKAEAGPVELAGAKAAGTIVETVTDTADVDGDTDWNPETGLAEELATCASTPYAISPRQHPHPSL